MKNLEDGVLIEMIKQSNHIAFHEFYQRHWEHLYLRAFSVLQNSDVSEDIVQDVFLEIWNRRIDLNIEKPSQYLFTCVKYAIFKVLQKQKLKERHLNTLNSIDLLVQAEDSMDTQEIEQAILDHLDLLPGRCKEIFVMSRFENMSNREIALKLSISTKTVENQIYRALKSLKSLIPQLLAVYLLLIFEDSLIKEFESILTFC